MLGHQTGDMVEASVKIAETFCGESHDLRG